MVPEISLEDGSKLRRAPLPSNPAAQDPMGEHVKAMIEFQRRGAIVFDYGNNLRQTAKDGGRAERLRFSGIRARVYPTALL